MSPSLASPAARSTCEYERLPHRPAIGLWSNEVCGRRGTLIADCPGRTALLQAWQALAQGRVR